MKTVFVPVPLLCILLLTGCNSGSHPAAPVPPAPSSTSSSEDTTGQLIPRIGINGKLGTGIDMGGGLTLSPSGSLGFGY